MAIHRKELIELERLAIAPVYARPGMREGIAKDAMPAEGHDPRVLLQVAPQ